MLLNCTFCIAAAVDQSVVVLAHENSTVCIQFDFLFPDLNTEELLSTFERFGDKLYTIGLAKVNWFTALQICAFQGMSLASIQTVSEHDNILKYINAGKYKSENFWIGATNLADNINYIWISNGRPISLKYWSTGQPDNHKENCLELSNDGFWNGLACNKKRYFICENRCSIDSYTVPLYL